MRLFGWDSSPTTTLIAAAPDVALEPEAVESVSDEPKPRFGRKAGRLTEIGQHWIDMDEVVHVDLDPEDGCAGEIRLRGEGRIHLSESDKRSLSLYLESEACLNAAERELRGSNDPMPGN